MGTPPYRVEFYQDGRGAQPIENYLTTLTDKEIDAVLRTVALLAATGPLLSFPHTKKLKGTHDLWELRIRHGRRHFRVVYTQFGDREYLLLHIFQKRSEFIRPEDIEIASRRLTILLQ
jgi:phage-related protein